MKKRIFNRNGIDEKILALVEAGLMYIMYAKYKLNRSEFRVIMDINIIQEYLVTLNCRYTQAFSLENTRRAKNGPRRNT